jgi:hypothetical protein
VSGASGVFIRIGDLAKDAGFAVAGGFCTPANPELARVCPATMSLLSFGGESISCAFDKYFEGAIGAA